MLGWCFKVRTRVCSQETQFFNSRAVIVTIGYQIHWAIWLKAHIYFPNFINI